MGYLTISNALQWRLQYQRIVTLNENVEGISKLIDKVTKEEYDRNLSENLDNLINKMTRFSYKPQPVRRTYIPKPGSDNKRPLGIPSYEDKLVQGAMAYVLNEIYETKFLDISY